MKKTTFILSLITCVYSYANPLNEYLKKENPSFYVKDGKVLYQGNYNAGVSDGGKHKVYTKQQTDDQNIERERIVINSSSSSGEPENVTIITDKVPKGERDYVQEASRVLLKNGQIRGITKCSLHVAGIKQTNGERLKETDRLGRMGHVLKGLMANREHLTKSGYCITATKSICAEVKKQFSGGLDGAKNELKQCESFARKLTTSKYINLPEDQVLVQENIDSISKQSTEMNVDETNRLPFSNQIPVFEKYKEFYNNLEAGEHLNLMTEIRGAAKMLEYCEELDFYDSNQKTAKPVPVRNSNKVKSIAN